MSTLLEQAGAHPGKQTRYAAIFQNRSRTGLYTNRNLLRDAGDVITERYYGGRADALIGGQNIEISPRLTEVRRPGLSTYSSASIPAPDAFYDWRRIDGTIRVMADTASAIYDYTPSAATLIFNKTAGSTQTLFQGVANTLYFGDGIDLKKYDGTNIWNWGTPAPTAAPSLTITSSGSAATQWVANTVFSTMGLLTDPNGNVEQLISVNALGNNSTQFGTTGNGQPTWNASLGGTTTDNTVTWTNRGPVGLWTPNTLYNNFSVGGTLANPCVIYDPASDALYGNTNPNFTTGTSGATRPNFSGINGSTISDNSGHGGITWFCIKAKPTTWIASHAYTRIGSVTNNDVNCSIVEPIALSAAYNPGTQPTIWQVATTGGTSGTGGTAPFQSGVNVGDQTIDNQLVWVNQGTATRANSTHYTAWGGSGQLLFSVIKDGNGNLQVCVISGTSGAVAPNTSSALTAASNASGGQTTYTGTFSPLLTAGFPVVISGFTNSANNGTFTVISCSATQLVVANSGGIAETHAGTAVFNPFATSYGTQIQDGTVTWVCVGPSLSWAASTQWYLPTVGFSPPQSSQSYGSASVIDSNSNIEYVTSSGKSGGSTPSWSATVGGTTSDGTITWTMTGAFQVNSLAWQKGYSYAYAYKARTSVDPYNTMAPPGWAYPLGTPTGSQSGLISTASLVASTPSGANTGSVNTIQGTGSADPQIDTIVIYRSADGGGTALLYFLTEIPNPAAIGGAGQPWSYKDFQPDSALDTFIQPALNHELDPPPAGFVPDDYHFGRVWGHAGNSVYASTGPDATGFAANGSEGFDPENVWTFPSPVTRCLATSSGMLVFTTSDLYVIAGGPSISSFYDQILMKNLGLLSFNALDVDGGVIYLFAADKKFWSLDPSNGKSEMGFAVRDQLAVNVNPANAYVSVLSAGVEDTAVYLADGSTGWYRVVPNQAPDGGIVWSPKANITGGCGPVQAVETSKGVHQLLVGQLTTAPVLKRDTTVFTDNGSPYDAFFTKGSIILATPGQIAELGFITADFVKSGTSPTPSYLLDETSGTFTSLALSVSDPPQLYGATGAPSTLFANRYYFSQNQTPGWCRHMQFKVDFGTDTTQNEMLTFTIWGTVHQEA